MPLRRGRAASHSRRAASRTDFAWASVSECIVCRCWFWPMLKLLSMLRGSRQANKRGNKYMGKLARPKVYHLSPHNPASANDSAGKLTREHVHWRTRPTKNYHSSPYNPASANDSENNAGISTLADSPGRRFTHLSPRYQASANDSV